MRLMNRLVEPLGHPTSITCTLPLCPQQVRDTLLEVYTAGKEFTLGLAEGPTNFVK